MVDSTDSAGSARLSRRIVIATARKRKTRAPARRKARPAKAARKTPPATKARKPARRSRATPEAERVPLGEAVADGFAMDRLAAPVAMRRGPKKAMRELGWAAFGEAARHLASRIALRYRPSAVVGIAKGGVFVGGALAAALGADFHPVRLEKRRRDPEPLADGVTKLPSLAGKKVLVVDDVASTGATLAKGRALARKAGAKEVRTAVLVARPHGARPDFSALETDELVLFGWDYQLDAGNGPIDPGDVGV